MVYLLHPGPSLLVTATFVAITALAMHAAPSPLRFAQLVALMLPLQFSIGIVNDLADVDSDARSKPYKPIARGAVSRRAATTIAVVLATIAFGAAASISLTVLLLTACGAAAGYGYDLGLRRTAMSALPWWAGTLVLPVTAFAAASRLDGRLWPLVLLTLLLSLALHCANGLPDIEGDRAAGRRGLPARIGRSSCWVVMTVSLLVCGALGLSVFRPAGAGVSVVVTAALIVAALATIILFRIERPFPILTVTSAAFAVAWLAAVAD